MRAIPPRDSILALVLSTAWVLTFIGLTVVMWMSDHSVWVKVFYLGVAVSFGFQLRMPWRRWLWWRAHPEHAHLVDTLAELLDVMPTGRYRVDTPDGLIALWVHTTLGTHVVVRVSEPAVEELEQDLITGGVGSAVVHRFTQAGRQPPLLRPEGVLVTRTAEGLVDLTPPDRVTFQAVRRLWAMRRAGALDVSMDELSELVDQLMTARHWYD